MAYAHPATAAGKWPATAIPAETIAWGATILMAAWALPYLEKLTARLLMLIYDVLMYH